MSGHGVVHARSQDLIDYAYEVAATAHGDQRRKYTGEPYITHPVAVAQAVAAVTTDCEMICAALLHDVLEDTPVTAKALVELGFGPSLVRLVEELTDVSKPSDGNRATRKALDRAHLAMASDRAKTVKLADLMDNTKSIVQHDPNFARVYMQEKLLLLPVLRGGDHGLWMQANEAVALYYIDHEGWELTT